MFHAKAYAAAAASPLASASIPRRDLTPKSSAFIGG